MKFKYKTQHKGFTKEKVEELKLFLPKDIKRIPNFNNDCFDEKSKAYCINLELFKDLKYYNDLLTYFDKFLASYPKFSEKEKREYEDKIKRDLNIFDAKDEMIKFMEVESFWKQYNALKGVFKDALLRSNMFKTEKEAKAYYRGIVYSEKLSYEEKKEIILDFLINKRLKFINPKLHRGDEII